MKLFVRCGGILLAITLIMGLLLGFFNSITAPVISGLSEQTQLDAMKSVIDGEITGEGKEHKVNSAQTVEKILEFPTSNGRAFAVVATPKGYGGKISLMIGIDQTGAVTGVSVMEMNETAGLGAKAKNQDFLDQFKGDNQEIKAITGATITTKAVKLGVAEAVEEVNVILKGAVK